jgi:ribosomal protein L37AE/L43A
MKKIVIVNVSKVSKKDIIHCFKCNKLTVKREVKTVPNGCFCNKCFKEYVGSLNSIMSNLQNIIKETNHE